jgi:hypothetical protein
VGQQLDCVAYQVHDSAHVTTSPGIKGSHNFADAPSLVVEWPGEQALLVREAPSSKQATRWASEFSKHVDGSGKSAAVSAAYGRFVVQWGPEHPSKEQGAVLLGCLHE